MTQGKNQRLDWLKLTMLGLGGALLSTVNSAQAQVVSDTTLPTNSTVTGTTSNFTITGGTQVGGNLFHSFGQFSIPTGGEAFFNNAISVQNIISRVTGLSASNIDGLLRANGSANLFLLNPNGIIFGPNANLNIGGSFVATTASSLNFADGFQFRATNPQATPLLSISVPIGIQFGANPGNIINSSRVTNSSGELVGLSVQPGATLALVGGEVALPNGHLTSLGGRVELGSVAANNTVSLTPTNPGWLLGYQGIANFQNISLSDGAKIAVNGDGKGSIAINANNINIFSTSNIRAGINQGLQLLPGARAGDITFNASSLVSVDNGVIANEGGGIGNGGNIAINAPRVSLSNGATIVAHSFGQGNAGNIGITATDDISINGAGTALGSQLFPGAVGNGGEITLKAPRVSLSNGAAIDASLQGTGGGGKVTIDATRASLLSGATIVAHSFGQGNAGSIGINATDSISVDGTGTAVGSQVFPRGVGNSGAISLKAPNVQVSSGAVVIANTQGTGNGGSIGISATDNISIDGVGTAVGSQVFAIALGNAGTITLNAPRVSVSNGATIVAHSYGPGNAGNIGITATDAISIDGTNTGVGSQVFPGGVGNSGTITLKAPNLQVSNSAVVVANNQGTGNGGRIDIEAARASLLSGATIIANTLGQGNGGSIGISATDNISVNGVGTAVGSQVFAIALGDAGTITLNAPRVSVSNGASIVAHSYGLGNAGNIGITATDAISIDGIETGVGSQVFASAVGNGGTIALKAPDVKVSGRAFVAANLEGRGNGGKIAIDAERMSLLSGATIATNTLGRGNAGSIAINATDTISIDGPNTGVGNQVLTRTAVGNGGAISLNAPKVVVSGGASIVTNTEGQGNAGIITINATDAFSIDGLRTGVGSQVLANAVGSGGVINLKAPKVTVSGGATIVSSTEAQGNAGSITIDANQIFLDGDDSGIASSSRGRGNSGQIVINTDSLAVTRGAALSLSSFGIGDPGSLTINAIGAVTFDGIGPDRSISNALSTVENNSTGNGREIKITADSLSVKNGAEINARTNGQGNGGNIDINVNTLQVDGGGQILTTSRSGGNAGNVKVNATRDVTLSGTNPTLAEQFTRLGRPVVPDRGVPSGIFANTDANATGSGGNITISTPRLSIINGAQLNAETRGQGTAGNLEVSSRSIRLENRGGILATTTSGNGGNISLTAQDFLLLRGVSQISTTAGTSQSRGDGGKININTNFIIGVPNENSDITANAFSGSGGSVDIQATGIFFLAPLSRAELSQQLGTNNAFELNPARLATNDITAISQENPNFNGFVNLNTGYVDPSQGLVALPTVLVDVSGLVDTGCVAFDNTQGSTFFVTGRGGLPPRPDDPLSNDVIWSDTRLTNIDSGGKPSSSTSTSKVASTTNKGIAIVPATGWVFNDKGEVTLISHASGATPDMGSTAARCVQR